MQGAVINISSIAAVIPNTWFHSTYGVAKAAQDKLTKDLAFEFASKGVRVNSILPGRGKSATDILVLCEAFLFEGILMTHESSNTNATSAHCLCLKHARLPAAYHVGRS
jgi:NAD(P)-dependent dehydrogenase (short-subunit alcohol dehydrogenase family)